MLRWAALTDDDGKVDHDDDPTGNKLIRRRSSAGGEDVGGEEDSGFWSKLLGKIVDNLVVEVRHVHIRVEDAAKWSSRTFCFGLSMKRFSATTCDAKGRTQFVERTNESTLLHRSVKCEEVALYWDGPESVGAAHSEEGWLRFLEESEFGEKIQVATRRTHTYLLKPCSPSVLVTKNDAPTDNTPRWSFSVSLGGIHVTLSRPQMEDATAIQLAAEKHIVRSAPNPRPAASVGRNPRAWWRYAIRLVVEDVKAKTAKRGWVSLCHRMVCRSRYVRLYKRTKKAPWLEPLSEREKEQLKELEDELDLNDVLAFRATALAELAVQRAKSGGGGNGGGMDPEHTSSVSASQQQQQQQQQGSRAGSWVRSFFGGGGSAQKQDVELTAEEKREIENAIDYLEAAQKNLVPETTLNMVIRSSLNNAMLTLVDENKREILHASVDGQLLVETCVGRSWKTSFHLVSFELLDLFSKDTMFPVLVAPKDHRPKTKRSSPASPSARGNASLALQSSSSSSDVPTDVMTVIVEVKPPGKREDIAVSIKVVPFKIVLVPSWVGAVSKFFAVSEETRLNNMATEAIAEWTESKQDDLVEALARRTLISLSVDIEDPIVACPLTVSRHHITKDTHMVVLDLGQLKIESDDARLRRHTFVVGDGESPEDLAVDAWRLRSKNVKAFLIPIDASSASFAFDANQQGVLFNDFDLDARLAVCITPKALNVAKTRISIAASALKLRAPPSLFRFASTLGTSWSKVFAGSSSSAAAAAIPFPESSVVLPPPHVPIVANAPPLLELDITVDALIATLSLDDSDDNLLARLELYDFALKHSRQANGDVDSQTSLKAVQVYDLFSQNPPLLATSTIGNDGSVDESKMIFVKTAFRKEHTFVDADFHQLHMNWNPETVAAYKDAYHGLLGPVVIPDDDEEPDGVPVISITATTPARLPASPTRRKSTDLSPSFASSPTALKPIKLSARLKSLSMALCKGEMGRVLAKCEVSDARVAFERTEAISFKFTLGNFKAIQPLAGGAAGSSLGIAVASTSIQPVVRDFEFFAAISGDHESLFGFEYLWSPPSALVSPKLSSSATPSDKIIAQEGQPHRDPFVSLDISPARLVYQHQMMLELADYLTEGVLGAMVTKATDTLTARTTEKYRVRLNWLSPTVVLPAQSRLSANPDTGFDLVCKQVSASNIFERDEDKDCWVSKITFDAKNMEVLGHVPIFQGKRHTTSLLRSPVGVYLKIATPLVEKSEYLVEGHVSAIEICLSRIHYFAFHRFLSENLFEDPLHLVTSPGEYSSPDVPHLLKILQDDIAVAESPKNLMSKNKVSYAYDRNDSPPSVFNVSVFFPTASLQILEEPGLEIATFAARRATLSFVRERSEDPTRTFLKVQVLDLVDDRPESKSRCFRHLILCDGSREAAAGGGDENAKQQDHAFDVLFVSALALVEINLHTFRSIVMLDLFSSVLNFIVTTEPDEGDLAHRRHHQLTTEIQMLEHPLADHKLIHHFGTANSGPAVTFEPPPQVTAWKGTFRLRRASMFFLCDLSDPETDAVVLGGDLELDWRKREDGCSSQWSGKIRAFELYRADLPLAKVRATNEQSSIALASERVGHQITEPADLSFSYSYEFDSLQSKIHTRIVSLKLEQLENLLSISDIKTLMSVLDSMRRGDTHGVHTSDEEKLISQKRAKQKNVPGWDYYQLGASGFAWPGTKLERPVVEAKTMFSELPVRSAARLARKRLENRRYSVEFLQYDFLIEFLEHDGFVTVGSVARDSIAYGMIHPGDVLIAVNYTPVLTKRVTSVVAIIQEECAAGSALTFTLHPAGCPDPLVLKDALQIESGAVVLHIIDDVHGRDLPLAHLSFSKIDAFRNGSNVGNTIVSGANLLLAMHYHDPISGRWEMLMSPWTAALGVQWHSLGQVEANFETSNELNFQLSDVFVRAMSDAARRVKTITATNPSGSSIAAGSGAFLLRNHTGLPLWYSIDEEDGLLEPASDGSTAGSHGRKIRVAQDETVAFSFRHERGNGKGTRRNYTNPRIIHIELGDEGKWRSLPPIPANIVHRGSITLTPNHTRVSELAHESGGGEAAMAQALAALSKIKVAWEIVLENGRLCLELRSFRRIKNALNIPIQVLASLPDRGSLISTVKPGEVVSLSVLMGDVPHVRIRPLLFNAAHEQSDHQWSEPCYVELAPQRGTSHVMCVPNNATAASGWRSFLGHVQMHVESEDGATVRFTVYPPIVVQNQLPATLVCRLMSGRSVVEEKTMVSGSFEQVHSLTVEGSSSLVGFKLENSREWTNMVRVERKKKIASTPLESRGGGAEKAVSTGKRLEETTQLSVHDGDGTIVPLSVVQETTEYDGVRFVVYCPIWLVNKTVLPLSYGYAQSQWSAPSFGTSCPPGVMMYASPEDSGGKLQVRVSESSPSAPFSVSTPDGKPRHVIVPGGSTWPNSFDMAVSVDVGPGELFRTNVVTFAPRYVFLNRLKVCVAVRQLWEDMITERTHAAEHGHHVPAGQQQQALAPPAVLSVQPNGREPFWASSSTYARPFRLQIRVFLGNTFETEWSNPFVLEEILAGRAVVPVELSVTKKSHLVSEQEVFRFNVEARDNQIAGSVDVDLSEYVVRSVVESDDVANANAVGEDDGAGVVAVAAEFVPVPSALSSGDPNNRLIKNTKTLPKTVIKFGVPKVVVILRRDVAAKQPKQAFLLQKQASSSSVRLGYSVKSSAASAGQLMALQRASSNGGSSSGGGSSGGGLTREIARAIVVKLDVTLGWRIDGLRELQLLVRELRLADPMPGAVFVEAFEGAPYSVQHPRFFSLHVIQRTLESNLVFEKFRLVLAGMKVKIDERFVLDMAQYVDEAVVRPWNGKTLSSTDGKTLADGAFVGQECTQLITDVLEHRGGSSTTTDASLTAENAVAAANATAATTTVAQSIFVNRLYISPFDIRLWYNQVKPGEGGPGHSPLVSFGVFSKFNIKIANSKLKFTALSLFKRWGSSNLFAGMVADYYEAEFRTQVAGLLVSSIDLYSAPFTVADTLYSRIMGSEVKSNEFRGESLSNEEIVMRYRRRLSSCLSLQSFLKDVVRSCVFDWSYNHTGMLNSRKALVVGVINRSSKEIVVTSSLSRGQAVHVLPGGLKSRQIGTDGVKITPGSPVDWESSATCLILAHGFLADKVDCTVRSTAFEARFDSTESILRSKPGFSAAFLVKEVSKMLSSYVIVVDEQVDLSVAGGGV